MDPYETLEGGGEDVALVVGREEEDEGKSVGHLEFLPNSLLLLKGEEEEERIPLGQGETVALDHSYLEENHEGESRLERERELPGEEDLALGEADGVEEDLEGEGWYQEGEHQEGGGLEGEGQTWKGEEEEEQ